MVGEEAMEEVGVKVVVMAYGMMMGRMVHDYKAHGDKVTGR